FLVTSVRGIGLEPTTSASAGLGVTGFMKAALAFRAGFFFTLFAMRSPLERRSKRQRAAYHETRTSGARNQSGFRSPNLAPKTVRLESLCKMRRLNAEFAEK